MIEEKLFLDMDRIPVFIGKEGSTKRLFEKKLNLSIDVDSKSGEVLVIGEDGLSLFLLSNMVHAINLGHTPEDALLLDDEHNVLDVIDIKDFIKNHDRLKVVIGRVIGKAGSTRKLIEDITKCQLAIKDSKVSVVGPYENTFIVHEALKMLIEGAAHRSIYSYLERNKQNFDNGLL